MQGIWLVADPHSFAVNSGHRSSKDRPLHFSLDYEEWFELYFDSLGVSKVGYEKPEHNPATAAGFIRSFTEEIEGYQMLSRINDNLVDVVFEIDETEPAS